MFAFLFLAQTIASPIDLGDRLWCQGEYKEAAKEWKSASGSDNPAIVAQSHYRRLLTASNLGWAVHGVLGDAALAECPLNDTRCALANVDRELYLSLMGLPADLEYARNLSERLLPHLPEAATARLVWLESLPVSALDAFNPDDLDGVGHCLQKSNSHEWDKGPGGAYIGFGLYGGGQLGLGGSMSWTQPNIDQHGGQLRTSVALTTQYAGGLFVSYTSVGEKWIQVNGNLQRRPFYLYEGDTPSFHLIETGSLSLRPGLRWKTGQAWLGPFFRQEGYTINDVNQEWRGIGVSTGAMWKPTDTLQIYTTGEYIEWEYHHLKVDGQLMWIHPSGWASMIEISASPNTEAPWWRLPTVGGGNVLRTAPAHRWRDEFLPSGVLEYRWRPQDTIGLVAFSEVTYAEDSLHGGGGLGIRIRMPPQPYNTMRFDIGYGDSGWNILFGAEEFFRFGFF